MKKYAALFTAFLLAVLSLTGCGQLGSENENMEQLMAGVIAMTKVSAPGLATYNESYHTFGLPYIFDSTEDFYHKMDSGQMKDFFLSSKDDGFVTLTYYTSGARSFYTKNKAIRKPEDLKGLKIRVQDMKSQTDMMNALGGIPVAMSYGDVYTSLQTGIIDGTENNETALTTGKHGEICKVFSTDQHAMIPDVMVMSAKVWETISPQDQQIILDAAYASTESHKIAWDAAIQEAVEEASGQMNVEFVEDVDKEAFREAISGMIQEYCTEYPGVQNLQQQRQILMAFLDILILVFAILVITIGGFKLAMSATHEFSALLGIPRSLVYGMAPLSGLFIIMAQIINIYEDVTGITIEGGDEK